MEGPPVALAVIQAAVRLDIVVKYDSRSVLGLVDRPPNMSAPSAASLRPCACPCRLGTATKQHPAARQVVQCSATGPTAGGRQQRRQAAVQPHGSSPVLGAASVVASLASAAASSAEELQPAAAAALDGASAAAAAAAAAAPAFTPGPVEVGWEIWAGFIAGVIPFVIASFEFGKRVVSGAAWVVCGGRGGHAAVPTARASSWGCLPASSSAAARPWLAARALQALCCCCC